MSETTDTAGAPVSSNDPDKIREEIESTRANLSSDVNALADRVNPSNVARRQVDKVRDGVGSIKDKVMGAVPDMGSSGSTGGDSRLSSAGSAVGDTASSVRAQVSSAPGQVRSQAQGNPVAAGVIAFGLGMLISSLIPTSDAEQQAAQKVKESAAPVAEAVKGAAQEAAENLKEPARGAADSLKQTATDAAATVQDEGRSAATDVKDQAQESRDNVQQSRG